MDKKYFFLFLISLLIFIVFYFSTVKSQNTNSVIGKYQISTCSDGQQTNWIFITIFDTETGEIIKQQKYDGWKFKEK